MATMKPFTVEYESGRYEVIERATGLVVRLTDDEGYTRVARFLTSDDAYAVADRLNQEAK